jgi:hypothetical protein
MIKRLEKLESDLLKKHFPDVHVIYVEKFRGETKEQAIIRYENENKVNSKHYVFILVKSDEQIRNEIN